MMIESDHAAVQVVFVRALDLHVRDLADPERPPARDIDAAVDLRRVGLAAALGDGRSDFVDDDLLPRADLALQPLRRDRLLVLHEAMPALLLHFTGNGRGKIVRRRARDRLVFETADAVERGFVQPFEQKLEILVGLARKSDNEGRADREIRTDLAPARDPLQRFFLRGRPAHALEHVRARMLERDVEIGQHLAVGHQRNDVVDMRVRIDILQPHPDAEFAERLARDRRISRAARGLSTGSTRI